MDDFRWKAEISYRTGKPTKIVKFEEMHELHDIVEGEPGVDDWHEIDKIVVTLSTIPSFHMIEKVFENTLFCCIISTKRSMSGSRRLSGMVGIRSYNIQP